jgi:glycosyltransferase involved in cell wall biosynthesis
MELKQKRSALQKLGNNDQNIRVVHIITKLELGGAQINTIYTYKNLNKNSFDTYLLSGDGGLLNDQVITKKTFIIIKNLIRTIHPLKDILAFFKICAILKKIQPHIVHTHSSKAGIIGRIAAFRQKIPTIIHSVHGFSFSPLQSYIKRKFYMWAEKKVASQTTHFIFVSEHDIKIAKKLKLVGNNYSLIRSGFEIGKFAQLKGDLDKIRQQYDIKKDHFVCGILAPFKPQKGLFHLIEIAVRVIKSEKNIIFFIAGDGKLKKKFMEELKKKKISEYFRLPGFIYPVNSVIDIFDCGLSTSLWEGLPQSLVQMRLKKKPIVASDIPGNSEIIKENQNGFLVSLENYKKFSEKILYLKQNNTDRNRLAQFNDDFADWDAKVMVKKQEELYIILLKTKIKK